MAGEEQHPEGTCENCRLKPDQKLEGMSSVLAEHRGNPLLPTTRNNFGFKLFYPIFFFSILLKF
jgi:hypothetical protein